MPVVGEKSCFRFSSRGIINCMLDYARIFQELNKKKIKYILAGGMAVNFYGIPRMTYDIDLLLRLEDKNLKKFLNLMKDWGFKPKMPVDIMDFADKNKREYWIEHKNMKAFNLVNPAWAISEIDIIINTPVDYGTASEDATRIDFQGVVVPVVSIGRLIKMKKASNRQQDKKDIIYLKKIKYAEKKRRV